MSATITPSAEDWEKAAQDSKRTHRKNKHNSFVIWCLERDAIKNAEERIAAPIAHPLPAGTETGCEKHTNFVSSEPFCPICMTEELDGLRAELSITDKVQRLSLAAARTHPLPVAVDKDALAALLRAQEFIRNGVALGFIRMPDADTPDPAHTTLPQIEAAIAALQGGKP